MTQDELHHHVGTFAGTCALMTHVLSDMGLIDEVTQKMNDITDAAMTDDKIMAKITQMTAYVISHNRKCYDKNNSGKASISDLMTSLFKKETK